MSDEEVHVSTIVKKLQSDIWWKQPGADDRAIALLTAAAPFPLPTDYIELLRWSNGGEGHLAGGYLQLWPAETVLENNRDYRIDGYLPGLLVFGIEGDRAFAFDFRKDPRAPRIVALELGALNFAPVVQVGLSLTDWLVDRNGARPD